MVSCGVHEIGVLLVVPVIKTVKLSRLAQRQLRKVPKHIVVRLQRWVELVEYDGLMEARRIPGFHDELLRGQRAGQRSIRLSRAYRAIYSVVDDVVEFALVEEVHKHEY